MQGNVSKMSSYVYFAICLIYDYQIEVTYERYTQTEVAKINLVPRAFSLEKTGKGLLTNYLFKATISRPDRALIHVHCPD